MAQISICLLNFFSVLCILLDKRHQPFWVVGKILFYYKLVKNIFLLKEMNLLPHIVKMFVQFTLKFNCVALTSNGCKRFL